MGQSVANADVAADPGVRAAQGALDTAQSRWVDLGVEMGLLVASTSPVGGQVADGISLARNVAGGNYGAALLDGIGFIPLGGDLIKGFFRGRSLRRAMLQADEALGVARAGLQRATSFARRRMASAQHWAQIRRRRQEVMDRYPNCRTAACRRDRDAELGRISNLPTNGRWVDADGNPVPAGTGQFVPNNPRAQAAIARARDAEGNPMTGVPYVDGQPDFSRFPPPGSAAPNGGAYTVEIDQAIGPNVDANRVADRGNAYAATRDTYPGSAEPSGGVWHHTDDGVTMQYVDPDIHAAATHTGSASVNASPGF